MSDPVKNVEIEDVLSSIRRLVTEEGREKPKAGAKPAQPVGRLVLTESLRVTEDAPEAEDAAEAEMVDESATDQAPETPVQADETGEVLTLGRDFRAVSYADEIEFRRDASRLRRGAHPVAAEAGAEDKATAKPGPKDVTYDLPKTPVGEFAEARTPWKRPEATLHEAAEVAAIAPEPSQEDDPKPEAVAAQPVQQAAAMRSATLSAKIKALEAAIAERAEKWEPDGSAEEVFETTGHAPLAWREPAEETPEDPAPVEAEPEAEGDTPMAVEAVTEDAEDVDSADDTVMDEEALRELVAEIVRQELRGALGERITRNVRKLVRREIQRALAAQALE